MPTTGQTAVAKLTIDLNNFRTVAQETELAAVKAMISISPSFFWGLMESLLDDGYLPTENIIVLKTDDGTQIVKEGNRRVASLKIALGYIAVADLDLPAGIKKRIATLSPEWLAANAVVPCSTYGAVDSALVDKIVTLTHGKGGKSGRATWSAVARARHNRDMNGASEAALDLLEKFFVHATNHTQDQKDRWAGDYNLTVLDEAIKRISSRLGATSSTDLAKQYPSGQHKKALDEIIRAIGLETLTFTVIREHADFAVQYGVPPVPVKEEPAEAEEVPPEEPPEETDDYGDKGDTKEPSDEPEDAEPNPDSSPSSDDREEAEPNPDPSNPGEDEAEPKKPAAAAKKPAGKVGAVPLNDERAVKRVLKAMKINGQNRGKVASLRQEAGKLKLADNPIAFCFLLRSMFEISAKAYCDDNAADGLSSKKSDGSDRGLMDVLRDIISHLTQNKADKAMTRLLHGPGTELGRNDGILSITSLNQLVHNPTFSIKSSDIPTAFATVYPLLELMNK
jgi:hypothetical protein